MKGLTLIELVIAMFIVGVLSAVSYIAATTFHYRGQISAAVADIRNIEGKLYMYYAQNAIMPPSLAEVGMDNLRDPWKRSYEYWPITGDPHQPVRKDRNLHPLNTDFDLFSIGRDGATNLALTAHTSQDDIIRASDGKFVGLASKY